MKNIKSINDFADYVESKGYTGYTFVEMPKDGFYAELKKGTAQLKDFTQIGLQHPSTTIHGYSVKQPSAFEWVRLGFADCNNETILKS